MPVLDPLAAREFAIDVVRRLRTAGFDALWAGGCVRDHLLGVEPKDYDVATNAEPGQIRAVFGPRRTLVIGQAFGVITVLGPRRAGQIEVATFRCEGGYSDGRRPDYVTFCSAQEDARRRDFTINGMFFDPLDNRVVDYVGGRRDLQRRLVRAIGNPEARFGEDKLRMLRAVRFASTFQFELDPGTLAAVRRHAAEIILVSAERIGAELRRMMVDANRARAVELLAAAGLLPIVFPELRDLVPRAPFDALELTPESTPAPPPSVSPEPSPWQTTISILRRLETSSFPVVLAALVRTAFLSESGRAADIGPLCRRLKLTAADRNESAFLLQHEAAIRTSRALPWPKLQRILIRRGAADLIAYGRAVAAVIDGHTADIDYAAQRLAQPREQLDPPPLITGDDLARLGIPSGPAYRRILTAVRDAQLEQRIVSREQALELAARLDG